MHYYNAVAPIVGYYSRTLQIWEIGLDRQGTIDCYGCRLHWHGDNQFLLMVYKRSLHSVSAILDIYSK